MAIHSKSKISGLSICSGVGGLDLGIELALGERYRTVGYVERDAYAAATLVARMEDKALGEAPIWADLFTFDPHPWRGKVDLISAGFPCQPFSVAGKKRAEKDERHLFPRIAEIICDVGPRFVFLKNVRGLLTASGGRVFGDVLGTLADLGFDSEWLCLRASAVGAPHRRERVFILGVSNTFRDPLRIEPGWLGGENREGAPLARDAGEDMAHAQCPERRPEYDSRNEDRQHALPQRGQGPGGVRVGGEDMAPFPPGPEDRDAWARVLAERPELSPALADSERGGLAGGFQRSAAPGTVVASETCGENGSDEIESEAEPELCGLDDGLDHWLDFRQDRLRCAGNGVVALQAAAAFSVLARQAGVMG